MTTANFLAGAAKVNITPPLGTRINGDFITHFANYIHDDLFARALVLRSGETTVAFVVIDTCIIPKEFADQTRKLIEAATGIPFQQILLSSTHTHAAGSLADVHLGSIDVDYTRALPDKILAAVKSALEALQPATIGHAATNAPEHVVCRRYRLKDGKGYPNPVTGLQDVVKTNPAGMEQWIDQRVAVPDTELSFLAVRSLTGEWISILANYSLHYVGDWANGTISADYFGVFASHLEKHLGGEMVAMMSNGTSGDVNIWDFLEPDRYPTEYFAKSKVIGEDLANKILAVVNTVQWEENPALSAAYEDVALTLDRPTADQLLAAEKVVSNTDYEQIAPDTPEQIRALYAREQLLLNQFPETISCPVQALRIGNIVVGALGGEFFAETGLCLKAEFESVRYFTITMANGNIGYVPPADQMALGGYETWRCRYRSTTDVSESKVREALSQKISGLL
ncbi:hypothetical protein GCM10023091_07560 [Ravibacter arvi]|uniref:Neutral/alkaline non-lysosomal ceramidase N-terminal domain-containing protein n=1 Tax=Ravibacter arvi TaxID=2051041 RepID=A0ABP8LRJ2_9BACT